MTINATAHVDYLSFSIMCFGDDWWKDERIVRDNLPDLLDRDFGDIAKYLYLGDDWDNAPRRVPYKDGLMSVETGRRVWFGGQNHVLFEFTGQGCAWLRDNEIFEDVLSVVQERVTRLDIAVDIETDERPQSFVARGYSKRIRTRNDRVSESGETVTLGSWKSERFVNVYRYNEPHPRAKTLRVEWRLKRDYARNAVAYLLAYSAKHVASMLNATYKIESLKGVIPVINESLPGKPDNRTASGTLLWVQKQVAPAIQRLIRDGVIEEPYEFFEKHFIPEVVQQKMWEVDYDEEVNE